MKDCIFCNIVSGVFDAVDVCENDCCKVILDRFPSRPGHLLVVSKAHYENVYDVDEAVYAEMMKTALRMAKRIKRVMQCNGVNILQNNEPVAGQTVFHIHIHVIPRFEGDEVTVAWRSSEPSIEDLEAVATKLRTE
ncbi:MAG: HIT family protein [Eubacteriales bacterium]|nr:HIT family protein [Eubacteriales bacterium]